MAYWIHTVPELYFMKVKSDKHFVVTEISKKIP